MKKLSVRSHSWYSGSSQLSWVYVMESLMLAFENKGHDIFVVSTNGLDKSRLKDKMTSSILGLREFGAGKKPISIDICYTIPPNLDKRFLTNSKNKCCIYNYETDIFPQNWKQYYHLADYYFPSSNFSAEIFVKNGIPVEKVFAIPHGVDTSMFNPDITPIKLKTKKKFRFISVTAPHIRKNIPGLLNAYCEAFNKNDDVCLVLKTKNWKHSDPMFDNRTNQNGRRQFEIILGDTFRELYKKFGKNMPEIELLSGYVDKMGSIYNAGDCFVSATGAEGWGMPFLDAMSCGLMSIAPAYSGQLHFLNKGNALLSDVKIRKAKPHEQYWQSSDRAIISEINKEHYKELMWKAVKEKDELLEKFKPNMEETVKKYSWENAAQMIIDATNGDMPHYIPGTYRLPR